jgi:hypothetical protein
VNRRQILTPLKANKLRDLPRRSASEPRAVSHLAPILAARPVNGRAVAAEIGHDLTHVAATLPENAVAATGQVQARLEGARRACGGPNFWFHRDGRRSPKVARPASMPCESAFRPQGSQKARRAKARDTTTKTKHDWNRLDATTQLFCNRFDSSKWRGCFGVSDWVGTSCNDL